MHSCKMNERVYEITGCIDVTIVTYVMDIIFIVNILMAVAVIFFERQNPNATLAWVMVLLFLPLVGFILYLIFNQNFTRKKMFEWDGQEKEGIQEAIHNQIQEINTGSYPFKNETSAAYKANIYMHLINDGALFTEDNDITIYTDGRKKFDAPIRINRNIIILRKQRTIIDITINT